ncbi:alpha-galactosidase [Rugosimonospora africana]|uniref:alpha-galactosidase n=1 Tax=Rugosimonospora africana TaxID=556532 RepID=UPI001943BAD0|nr:alpha-galactosidase [Rugosimonospora africana]
MADTPTPNHVHFHSAGVSVVFATGEDRLPRLLYWGASLGELSDAELGAIETAQMPPFDHNPNDQVWNVSILPEFEAGWLGRPGLEGSRDGRDWSPAFRVVGTSVHRDAPTEDGRTADRLRAVARDDHAELSLELTVDLLSTGLLRARASVTNTGEAYRVDAVRIVLPVPSLADELLDFTGRHLMERVPQRCAFPVGLHAREQRGGRTGLDAAHLLIAGRGGFGFRDGEVWGAHVAFSGNQSLYAERLYNGARALGGGELLQSGEIVLARGESYTSPWFYGAYGDGLDEMAARFHAHVRSGRAYPAGPRPVVVNSWEAVYFNHDIDVLGELVDRAAEVGAERFVLDDGWFGSRRDDHSGLGDWTVSPEVWPDGLHPLIKRVKERGMDFGLWVEPEMVNLDSDLARAHPEWLFSVGGRVGYSSRYQHVLDLTHPGAYAHIRDALLALLDEYDIAYLKWDHNRTLVEAGHAPEGRPAIHGQTLAVYRLMDELRAAHAGLEIESCASGSGRVDLGILEHVQRVWGSDTNDPVERQQINRYLKLLVPPELIGAHVGPSPSHTTGRTQTLQFRAQTAVWCHLGIEIDLRTVSPEEFAQLAAWVAFYREHRHLLHGGTVVNADHPDDAIWVSGVVSPDHREAWYGVATLRRSVTWPPGPARLPGLAEEVRYVATLPDGIQPAATGMPLPEWTRAPRAMTGAVLGRAGVALPRLLPETGQVIHAREA